MILTLIPDWSTYLGLENKGSFFIAFTLASLSIRFLSGKASDRFGRKRVAMVGLSILAAALFTMAIFKFWIALLIGGILYGFSMGILSPKRLDGRPKSKKRKG